MQPVVTAAEARALDAATIAEVGLPGVVLMEAAGRGVAAVVLRECAARPGPVAVVCGGGGNGGDGYVVARVLRAAGIDATAYAAVARATVTGDAAVQFGAYVRSGGAVIDVLDGDGLDALRAATAAAAIVVDAVLGIGVTRAVTGHLAAVIDAINAGPGRRIAIDVPSGLDADTGQPRGACVRADVTVAMVAPKLGAVIAPGVAWAGESIAVDIGVPASLLARVAPRAALVTAAQAAAWRRTIDPLTHKHRRGHVVVLGGSSGMRGAGRLAALAALRAGAGLVTLASPDGLDSAAPDAVMTAAPDSDDALGALLGRAQAVALGPGLAIDPRAAAWIAAVLAAPVPAVLDAGALTALAGRPDALADAVGAVVITPHPGEAARLLSTTTATIEADRPAAVRALAAATRAVVVLKGPRTLICDGRHGADAIVINPTGGPALATAGSGDVLTGIIAALLAAGHPAAIAAALGAYLHGAAGDHLAATLGAGVIASDLPDAVARAAASL